MNSSFWSERVLPHFPFTNQKSESQTEESNKSTLVKKTRWNQPKTKPTKSNKLASSKPESITVCLLSHSSSSSNHPLPPDSKIGLGVRVPRGKQTEEVPHGLRLEGSSGKGAPEEGIGQGGRRPLGARRYQLHPLPAGSRAALGTRVSKARQKQGFPHLSASSRRQPCLGFCEPGAGSPGGGQRWRERSCRRRARRSCAAGGAQRSAPPVRLAAELGISCLLSSLYVASSH